MPAPARRPHPATEALINQVVAGRYRIVRLVGHGGMGNVFEVQHAALPKRFALKILRPDLAQQPDFVERFRREAIAASRIEHPNVVSIVDFGHQENAGVYLVMEYLRGEGLDELLSRQSRLPLNRVLPILLQVADALDCAHEAKVVHRDLKPENIWLTELRRRKDVVKILDFGIAQVQTPELSTEEIGGKGKIFGTAEYMAPEQVLSQPLDGRADIYALGCLAYELITGNPPFEGEPLQVLRAQVRNPVGPPSNVVKDFPIPPALDALVLRCLAKDREHRYPSGAAVCQDLLRVQSMLVGIGAEIGLGRVPTGEIPALPKGKTWPPTVPAPLALTGEGLAVGASPPVPANFDQLRDKYHEVLRELAIALVQASLSPPETSELLERLLIVEEEAVSLNGAIALSEQGYDRIRFEYGQREKRLRTALMDLSSQRTQRQAEINNQPMLSAAQPALDDLNFQIQELSQRCNEIVAERQMRIVELNNELSRQRKARETRERETADTYQSLYAQVDAWRPRAKSDGLKQLYKRLDELRAALSSAGREI